MLHTGSGCRAGRRQAFASSLDTVGRVRPGMCVLLPTGTGMFPFPAHSRPRCQPGGAA